MADLVKWLTRRIVAPVCKGSIPLVRPIFYLALLKVFLFLLFFDIIFKNLGVNMINFYDLLDIKPTATKEEIKTSYKKTVKKYQCNITDIKEENKIIQTINEAKDILLDNEKRKEYDTLLNDIKYSKQFSFNKEETYYTKTEEYKNNYEEEYITKLEFFFIYLLNIKDNIWRKILNTILVIINFIIFFCIKAIALGIIFFISLLGNFADYIVGFFMLCGVLSLFLLIGEKSPNYIPFIPANIEEFCIFSITATIIATIKYFLLSSSSNLYVFFQNAETKCFLKILNN